MKLTQEFKDVCKVVFVTAAGLASVGFTATAAYVAPQEAGFLIIAGGGLGLSMGFYTANNGHDAWRRFSKNNYRVRKKEGDGVIYQSTYHG